MKEPTKQYIDTPNGIRVVYPRKMRMTKKRLQNIDTFCTSLQSGITQPILAVYFNKHNTQHNELWNINIRFACSKPQQPYPTKKQ